ncbi:AraC-like DNA-binding protein [Mesonia hippocampi]|uniref:AraC-like DNA-binding protein n=1 Tax=Mesonia hippocampi TaxID=1628250 RepID=A0A840ELX4_9FLAO|nr:helix-turn-helix domain-containing protein [Mesonia hippocampi]MBB4118091.1 AraC-like DNA-binding protein [Mesonia hippocampi]
MLIHLIQILVFSSLILLSFIMLSNPLRVNRKANIWFGITLFLWSSFWLEEIILLTKAEPFGDILNLVISFIQFFTPIFLYISVLFFSNPNYKFSLKDSAVFIIPIVYLVAIIYNYLSVTNYQLLLVTLILVNAIVFITKSFLRLRIHQRKITLFSSNTDEINLKWLENIILVIMALVLIISVFNLIYIGLPLNLYLNIITLGVILFMTYNALKQKEIFPTNQKHREDIIAIENDDDDETDTTKRKIIKDKELVLLKAKLNALMKAKHLYLDNDINLASLAEEMQITSHQLSYVINNGFNQNFYQFINTYRIEKAKELLLDKSSQNLTILGIAYESGFNSKTAFNTTFKKFTNLTPTEFKNQSSTL